MLQRANIVVRFFWNNKLKAFLVGVAASLIATFVWTIVAWYRDSPYFEPYIAVVVSTKSVDFPIPAEFLRGFQDGPPEGKTYLETRDNRKVDIRILEDFGSIDEASRIAKGLLEDKNCILVIGNSNSTVTAVSLDVFLKSKDPPAYILPIATRTNLIAKARTGGHRAVLRMVPDNANQALVVQRLVYTLSEEQRVAIYGDQENPLYSNDLARDIASRVREKGGRIIVEEMIGPTNSIYSSLPVWQNGSAPEIIVYVGVAHHGLLIIDQLKELGISVPIVFTDGCMVGPIIENVARIPNRAFVLSPVGAKSSGLALPTYEPIGRDAYTLASKLIGTCSNCTRAGLRGVIAEAKDQAFVANGHAGEYRFNADGDNTGMSYKIYEITGGDLVLRDDL